MKYMTVDEAAELWGIGARRVQMMCSNGLLAGAAKKGGRWAIPADCPKPEDMRRLPVLREHPKISAKLQKQLADGMECYLRTDFRGAMTNFESIMGIERCWQRSYALMLAADICVHRGSINDLRGLYNRLCQISEDENADLTERKVAQFARVFGGGYILTGEKFPAWFTNGDLRGLPQEIMPLLCAFRSIDAGFSGRTEAMLGMAVTTSAIAVDDVPARILAMLCATYACVELGRVEEANEWFYSACDLAFPLGYVMPFVELAVFLPQVYSSFITKNWPEQAKKIAMMYAVYGRNLYLFQKGIRGGVDLNRLTLREQQIVNMARRGLKNKDIAKRLEVTESNVKMHLHSAYLKLGVSGRRKLSDIFETKKHNITLD